MHSRATLHSAGRLIAIVAGLIAGFAVTPAAQAVPTITFDQVVDGGTVAYSTVGGSLVGTDVRFDFLVALGTSADGEYACSNCSLDFTTGAAYNDTDGPNYSFHGGGSFVLTGGIADMGIADGSILLTGTFTEDPTNFAVTLAGPLPIISFFGFGIDEKNATLAAFLGIDAEAWRYANSELSIGQATVNADGTFSGTVTEADLANVKLAEPTTLALMGVGLGLFGFGMRRRQQAK
jgi:hypothetical protein